jgi:porin
VQREVHSWTGKLALIAWLILATSAIAGERENLAGPTFSCWGGKSLSAEWDRFRSDLRDRGIALEFIYRGELIKSAGLDPSNGTDYRGLLDLALTFQTEKMALWPGGELFLRMQNGHGRGFNVTPAGVVLPISNIDAQDFTQVSEYGLKQSVVNSRLRLTLGKQDVNKVFCKNEFGSHLLNPSYALIPTVPMPTFPAPALGVTLVAEPAKWLSLGGGFYDGGPKVGTLGFETALEGKGGYFSIFETGGRPSFGIEGHYPGNYRFGLWYHTGDFAETNPGQDSGKISGNYGFYLMIDQLVYKREKGLKGDQGLGVFFQLGWAPSDRNQVTGYVGAGCSYKGFLPSRPDDTIGIGASYTLLIGNEPQAGQRTDMTNVEFFYQVPLAPWISLRPDIQYFDNPGGGRKNGWAAGLRSVIQF